MIGCARQTPHSVKIESPVRFREAQYKTYFSWCAAEVSMRYTFPLMLSPPVSYTIPLPTQAMVCVAPSGLWLRTANAGGCSAALPTP